MDNVRKNNKPSEIEDLSSLSSLSSLNPPLSATTNSGVGKLNLGVGSKANTGHGTGTKGDTV